MDVGSKRAAAEAGLAPSSVAAPQRVAVGSSEFNEHFLRFFYCACGPSVILPLVHPAAAHPLRRNASRLPPSAALLSQPSCTRSSSCSAGCRTAMVRACAWRLLRVGGPRALARVQPAFRRALLRARALHLPARPPRRRPRLAVGLAAAEARLLQPPRVELYDGGRRLHPLPGLPRRRVAGARDPEEAAAQDRRGRRLQRAAVQARDGQELCARGARARVRH